jgi:all-trans-retinol 13,14-reductase
MSINSTDKFDIVVAGSGLGGLYAAARLVKENKKVLLLEKHLIVGGYASYFKRKGFRFETSLHALDGLWGDKIGNMAYFDEFDLSDSLSFIRLHEFFRVVGADLDITIPDTVEGAKAAYLKECPDEKEAIDEFFRISEKIYHQIMKIRGFSPKELLNLPKVVYTYWDVIKNFRGDVESFLAKITDNERLKQLIGVNISYYHDDPFKYSVLHFLAAQAMFFGGGASQVKGGSYAMATALHKYILDNGGEVRTRSEVTDLRITEGKISGVAYTDLNTKKSVEVISPVVVGNIPFPILAEMLPEKESNILKKPYAHYTKSPSIFCIYLGLKQPLSSIGVDNYSTIILPSKYTKFKEMFTHYYTDDYSERISYLTNYSALDLFPTEGNKPTATCITLDTMDKWENLSEEEYTAKKEQHCEELLSVMEEKFPGFRDCIEYISIASPKTFERYTGNPGGSVYGFAQDVKQLGPQRPQQKSKVPGLYLASAWAFPGGGMMPAIKSGSYAADEILKAEKKSRG